RAEACSRLGIPALCIPGSHAALDQRLCQPFSLSVAPGSRRRNHQEIDLLRPCVIRRMLSSRDWGYGNKRRQSSPGLGRSPHGAKWSSCDLLVASVALATAAGGASTTYTQTLARRGRVGGWWLDRRQT